MGMLEGSPLAYLTGGVLLGSLISLSYHKNAEVRRISTLVRLHEPNIERHHDMLKQLMILTEEKPKEEASFSPSDAPSTSAIEIAGV